MPQQNKRFLGITILGDFILNEGVDAILDNVVKRAGATAVALNPTVTAQSPTGQGSFQPPDDAGSSPRRFDRTLWGKHALWVRSGASYHPNKSYYTDTPYQPRQANDLTDTYGPLISQFINTALERGLEVYLQLGAAQPPNLRDADIPRLPNGQIPNNRMAATGCLASDAIRAYNRAYVRDLLDVYPNITGFRPDWPEYPCYKLDEAFQDFNPQVASWATAHGFDFDRIQAEVGTLYTYLHGSLKNTDLVDWAGPERGHFMRQNLLRRYPGIAAWWQLKAALSVDILKSWRTSITEYGGPEMKLSANAFMTPYALFTGFDYAGAAAHCQAISPKLYTMHWSAMIEFWGTILLKENTALDETLVVKALAQLFDLGDEITATSLNQYGYPEPDQPHPVDDASQQRKINQVMAAAGADVAITPLVHGYGPLNDFARRFKLVADSSAQGIWINRYGYLSDAKLDVVGEIWR